MTCLRFAQCVQGGIKESRKNCKGWEELEKQRKKKKADHTGQQVKRWGGMEAGTCVASLGEKEDAVFMVWGKADE